MPDARIILGTFAAAGMMAVQTVPARAAPNLSEAPALLPSVQAPPFLSSMMPMNRPWQPSLDQIKSHPETQAPVTFGYNAITLPGSSFTSKSNIRLPSVAGFGLSAQSNYQGSVRLGISLPLGGHFSADVGHERVIFPVTSTGRYNLMIERDQTQNYGPQFPGKNNEPKFFLGGEIKF